MLHHNFSEQSPATPPSLPPARWIDMRRPRSPSSRDDGRGGDTESCCCWCWCLISKEQTTAWRLFVCLLAPHSTFTAAKLQSCKDESRARAVRSGYDGHPPSKRGAHGCNAMEGAVCSGGKGRGRRIWANDRASRCSVLSNCMQCRAAKER